MSIDTIAFERIYEEFARKIYAYCLFRVRSKEEAEDIAASVFIRAWNHVAAGKAVDNISPFLYRIASNLIVDHYRKGRDRREVSLDNPSHPIDVLDVSVDTAVRMDHDALVGLIRAKLSELPDIYRETIVLKYLQDLSVKEIAQALKTSENNISVRLYRGIEKLKTLMNL